MQNKTNQLLHTPEGVRDIYGEEYARKLKIEELLHNTIMGYGYKDIQTPTFEFFDVFSKEVGTTPSKELYKFFDKEGNTLVLRPDFTPSMARCAAKYFCEDEFPIRFCYVGNTFTNTSNLQGKLKEVTEMGAELMGVGTAKADAEMIALVVQALLSTGLKDFQVSVGQIEFFKGLCEAAGLDEETEIELREFINGKNMIGAEEFLKEQNIPQSISANLLKVSRLFGNKQVLEEAKEITDNTRSLDAIKRLEEIYDLLCIYGVEDHISFDLGLLSKYNYYTGVIFKAYTYGVGDAIVTGGRYDTLLGHFGKQSPAIGFMVVIDDLMSAISSQKITVPINPDNVLIVYEDSCFQNALKKAINLREENMNVELICKDDSKTQESYLSYARKNLYNHLYFVYDEDAKEVY